MTISSHEASAMVGGVAVVPASVSLSLDETRAPYASATLEFRIPDAAALAAMDPRKDARVAVSMVQSFGVPFPMANVTATVQLVTGPGPITMADVYATFPGPGTDITLGNITETLAVPYTWTDTVPAPSTRVDVDLGMRSRRVLYSEDRVIVTASSDEALLMDYRLVSSRTLTPAGNRVIDCVQLALSEAVPGSVLDASGSPFEVVVVEADSALWAPGTSAWDYVLPITASVGLRLWCDERGVWHLAEPGTFFYPGTLVLTDEDNIGNAEDEITREGQWHDGVVVSYRYTNPTTGLTTTRYDVAGSSASSSRAELVEYSDRAYPGTGEAAARLRRLRELGRQVVVEAAARYDVAPAQAVQLTIPAGGLAAEALTVASVEWSQPGDRMRIVTREPTVL